MFTYDEMLEISRLCEENEKFAKYVNRFREENDKLLSKVTHELRNPLTLISSTAQLIERRNPEVCDIKYWNQMRADIASMAELLASFSKYRYSGSLECKETDIVELVDEVVESFQAIAVEKNISITMEEPEHLNYKMVSYMCDPVKLRQAMVNLIKNAIEAVEEEEKIWISFIEKEPSHLKIEIANNGKLITTEDMERIFEFNVSSKGEERGMGLPIAQRIVEAHKGILEVSSKEINGERKTAFSICLPM